MAYPFSLIDATALLCSLSDRLKKQQWYHTKPSTFNDGVEIYHTAAAANDACVCVRRSRALLPKTFIF